MQLRDEVVAPARRAADRWTRRTSTRRSTATRARRSISFGSPRTSTGRPPSSSRKPAYELPGVEVVVEARREYTDGTADVAAPRLHGPGVGRSSCRTSATEGYLPDDLLGKVGVEAPYETELRGTYGARERRARRDRPADAGPRRPCASAVPGASLTLTIDTQDPAERREGPASGRMDAIGMKRGVVIVMNPQTGEILAMVSLPTYDNNLFARGISAKDFDEAPQEQGQAAPQPRHPGALPAGIDVQARDRHGRPRRRGDHRQRRGS